LAEDGPSRREIIYTKMSRGSSKMNHHSFFLKGQNQGMAGVPRTLFYDATCGFCGGAVSLLRRADRRSGSLVFEPLGGERFLALLPAEVREGLPDSLVLLSGDGRVLVRSAAVLEALDGIGGAWKALAHVARLLPVGLRDRAYDWVARNRNAGAGCRVRG
jgi:predicted DCC family thiol-disulfide oxidoreductase YuxK